MSEKIKKHSKKFVALICMLTLMFSFFVANETDAALDNIKDTLSDSRFNTASDHTIAFTVKHSSLVATNTIAVVFEADFTANVVFADIDIADDTDDYTLDDGACASNELGVVIAGNTITFTLCTGTTIADEEPITIEIGSNAGGTAHITNPAAATCGTGNDSYVCDIDVTTTDESGTAKVAIISGVDVTATVTESLTFVITGKNAGDCDAIANSDSEINTSATGVPFGDTGGDEFIDGCQSLTVGTNASSGYSTTVQELDQLKNGANTITSVNSGDGSCDGSCTETTAAVWTTDTNNGFAYCMSDSHTGAAGDAAVTAGWAAAEECNDAGVTFQVFPENGVDSPDTEVIMSSAANLTTDDISYIGYRLSADPLSVAVEYSNILIFVTTPTY